MNSESFTGRNVTLKWLWILNSILCVSVALSALFFAISYGSLILSVVFFSFLLLSVFFLIVFIFFSRHTDSMMRIARSERWRDPFDSIRFFYSVEEKRLLSSFLENDVRKTLWEENKRQVQYKALQNQINPHFLYNTLEAIRSEALIGGLESVADMAESLAKFFRYTISNMEDFVTLADEIRNVRDYMRIQTYRFGDRIRLRLPVLEDEEILKTGIPKLILQPIVENAIIHGLEEKKEGGVIEISSVQSDDYLEILVKDDGCGIDSDRLIEMNRNLASFSSGSESAHGGIAIYNVNNRLHLLFGGQSGLAYYSIRGMGTTAVIRIPRQKT